MQKRQRGELNPNWKGGIRQDRFGYVYIYAPNHPYASVLKVVKRARLVMEEVIERFLTKEEVIHHKNGIQNDDRPDNLAIMTLSDHSRLHSIFKEMTHCCNGHELTVINTYVTKQGYRQCRTCHRERELKYDRKRQADKAKKVIISSPL